MGQQLIFEGTSKDLVPYLAQRPDQRFRLIALSEEAGKSLPTPNEVVLAMLREVANMKVSMAPTHGEETDRLLREARAGAMYSDGNKF